MEENTTLSGGGGGALSRDGTGTRFLECSGGPPISYEDRADALVLGYEGDTVTVSEGKTAVVGPYEVRVTEISSRKLVAEIERIQN
jgi:hypothetical protein